MLVFNGDPLKIEKVKGLLKDFNCKIATSQAESKKKEEGRQLDRPVTGKEVKDVEVISDKEFHGSSKRSKTDCESEWVCLGRMTASQGQAYYTGRKAY